MFIGPAIISLEPLRPLVREGDGSARVNITLRGASHPLANVSITTSSLTAASEYQRERERERGREGGEREKEGERERERERCWESIHASGVYSVHTRAAVAHFMWFYGDLCQPLFKKPSKQINPPQLWPHPVVQLLTTPPHHLPLPPSPASCNGNRRTLTSN